MLHPIARPAHSGPVKVHAPRPMPAAGPLGALTFWVWAAGLLALAYYVGFAA